MAEMEQTVISITSACTSKIFQKDLLTKLFEEQIKLLSVNNSKHESVALAYEDGRPGVARKWPPQGFGC